MNEIKILSVIAVLFLIPLLFMEADSLVTTSDSLITIDSDEVILRLKSNGTLISSNPILLAGFTITGTLALAVDPVTEKVYAVIDTLQDAGTQRLVTLNVTTGTATSVGTLSERLQTIAFKEDGNMRAITEHHYNDKWWWWMSKKAGTESCGTALAKGEILIDKLRYFTNGAFNGECQLYIFKSFENSQIDGSTFFLNWFGQLQFSQSALMQVVDGFYDLNDFTNGANVPSKGNGGLQGITFSNPPTASFALRTDSLIINTTNSLTGFVTLFVRSFDNNANNHGEGRLEPHFMNLTGSTNAQWTFTNTDNTLFCVGGSPACTFVTNPTFFTNSEGTFTFGTSGGSSYQISGQFNDPQRYFAVDKNNASLTKLCNFANTGIGGDQLAFNWNDLNMYRFHNQVGTEKNLQMSFITDETTCVEVVIPYSGEPIVAKDLHTGVSYHTSDGLFFATSSASQDYYTITALGVGTLVQDNPFGEIQNGLEFLASILFDPPTITLIGSNFIEVFKGATYNDQGATCFDNTDGDLTSQIVTGGLPIDTSIAGVNVVTYDCQDSSAQNAQQVVRNVVVLSISSAGGGAGVGSPVAPLDEVDEEDLLTQAEFDLALAQALAQIPPQQLTVIETVIRTFFEFAVVDTTLDDLSLNSFLQNERLGIRWSSGQDIVVVSAIPAVSPFQITFEQFPVIKQGSGAVVSTDFLVYNLQVPINECTNVIRSNCALKVRYEVPITVNAILNGTNVSDVGTITVDLREGEIDPILLIILATFSIPIIGAIVQRQRGRSAQVPIGKLISG